MIHLTGRNFVPSPSKKECRENEIRLLEGRGNIYERGECHGGIVKNSCSCGRKIQKCDKSSKKTDEKSPD